LLSSPVVRGGNLVVTEKAIRDTVRQVMLPLWNCYYFFALYAGACNNGEGYAAKKIDFADREKIASLPVMDRYLIASVKKLVEEVDA
ncbi:hypothetical protein, partial [Streptococcus agalactiae]